MWWTLSRTSRAKGVTDTAGRPLTLQEYYDIGEVKLELIDGYIGTPEMRTNLLRALVINEGLNAVIRLAPREALRKAMKQSYTRL
jgi:hypothetical protein